MSTPPLIRVVVLILISLLMGCTPPNRNPTAVGQSLVVFLVRHAEKVDSSADPALSATGRERATTLATTLRSAKLEFIHSSDFSRTRDTAAPIAAATGLSVQLYDPRDLQGLAKKLKQVGGRHLVVGHSNTTPTLAGLLGGDPGTDIDEASEYDRLYIVSVGADGTASSVLLRYGNASSP